MQENQELKSESEGTTEHTCEVSMVSIRPMATPHRVSFQLPFEDLDAKFEAYWNTHWQSILEALKGKVKPRKVKGGAPSKETRQWAQKVMPLGQMYGEVLSDLVSSTIVEDLLFVEGVSVYEFEPGRNAQVVGIVYYRPSLIVKDELNLACQMPEVQDVQENLNIRYKEVQFSHRIITAGYEGPIDELCRVKVTLTTTSEGSAVPEMSCVDNWLMVSDLRVEGIHDQLLGKKVGDLFEISYEDALQGGSSRKFISVIKVHEVEKYDLPEVNDALAIKEGFESLAQFNEVFKADFQKYQDNRLGAVALDSLLHNVITQSELPPIPSGWTDIWLERVVSGHVAQFRGDRKKAMAAVGAKTEAELRDRFRGQVYSQLWSSLAANWLADQWGIPFKNNPQVSEQLQKHALSVVKWVK